MSIKSLYNRRPSLFILFLSQFIIICIIFLLSQVAFANASATIHIDFISGVINYSTYWGLLMILLSQLVTIVITFLLFRIGGLISEISFDSKTLFTIIVFSSYIFIIQYFLEFIWLLFFSKNYSYIELRHFNLLSLFWIHENLKLPWYFAYAFETFNLFELLYIIVIYLFLIKHCSKTIIKAFLLKYYIIPFFFWIVLITYLQVTFMKV
ncbi:MAG: hypothetical protein RLZZ429_747 [Bacteroidota bacterium]|jgi:hypothetical protein